LFILSADFELLWAHRCQDDKKGRFLTAHQNRVREDIYALLSVLEQYEIPSTWAVVGHLFLDHCDKHDGVPHPHMPRFEERWYSCDPCTDIRRHPLFYGRDIVQRIIASPVENELGYHSFSHVRFSECDRVVAQAEINEGLKIASECGLTLKSFVFPQNRIGNVQVLKEHHFEIYRGPNRAGKHINKTILRRAPLYFFTHLIPPPVEAIWREGIWELPSSMKFYSASFLSALPFRAKNGIAKAIKENKIFHVFIHPEDFVANPALLDKFDQTLQFVAKKRDQSQIEVVTMGRLAESLNQTGQC
jgi:peptidoglycan/xylan/chitin deacetylase (PgdA/CDA1 family)